MQEVLADGEFKVGMFYHDAKGSFPAAANRLQAVTDQYPLYSRADDDLMALADSYHRMGDNFENQEAAAYSQAGEGISAEPARDGSHAPAEGHGPAGARSRPGGLRARRSTKRENRAQAQLMSKVWGPFSSHPNTVAAAQSGSPNMETLQAHGSGQRSGDAGRRTRHHRRQRGRRLRCDVHAGQGYVPDR